MGHSEASVTQGTRPEQTLSETSESTRSLEKSYAYLRNDVDLMEHAHLPKERGGFEGYRDWAYEQFVLENPTLLSSNFAGFKEVVSKDQEIGNALQRILARRKERLKKQPVKISGVSQKAAQEQGVTSGPVSTPSHEVAMQEPGDKLRIFLQNHPHVAFDATQFDVLDNKEFMTSYKTPRRILLAAAKDNPITIIDIPDLQKNQDSVAYEKRDDGIVNIAVADGVSGAVHGGLAPRIATRGAIVHLRDHDVSPETIRVAHDAIQTSDIGVLVDDYIALIRKKASETTDYTKLGIDKYADDQEEKVKKGYHSSTMLIAAQYDRGNNRLRVALKGDSQVVVINHEGMQAPIEGKMRDQIVYGDPRPFDVKEVIFQEISLADGDVVLIQTDGSESTRDPLKTMIEQFVRNHRGEQNLDRLLAEMIGEELFTQTPDDDITTVILCHKAIHGEEDGPKLAQAPFSPGATADAASKSKSSPSKYVPSPPPLLVQPSPKAGDTSDIHSETPGDLQPILRVTSHFEGEGIDEEPVRRIKLEPGKDPIEQVRASLRDNPEKTQEAEVSPDLLRDIVMKLPLPSEYSFSGIDAEEISLLDLRVVVEGEALSVSGDVFAKVGKWKVKIGTNGSFEGQLVEDKEKGITLKNPTVSGFKGAGKVQSYAEENANKIHDFLLGTLTDQLNGDGVVTDIGIDGGKIWFEVKKISQEQQKNGR